MVTSLAPVVVVCQETFLLRQWESFHVPEESDRKSCPRDYYVRGSRSGSPYAQWDYSAGYLHHTDPPTGKSANVSWGGVIRVWEANGRWVGGVQPLLTNWLDHLGVQVFFYCEPGPPWPAQMRTALASPFAGPAGEDEEGFPPEDEEGFPPEEEEEGFPPEDEEEESWFEDVDGSPLPSDAEPAPESAPGVEADPPESEWIVVTLDEGEDTLFGPDGPARLVDDEGDDTLIGGTGEQTLLAGLGDNTLRAGRGKQTLIGGPGRNTLIGAKGQQRLFTAGPRNRIIAGKGPSTIVALGKKDSVDCRNHRATVVAIRGVKVKRCRKGKVRRVKAPAWTRKPPWVIPSGKR